MKYIFIICIVLHGCISTNYIALKGSYQSREYSFEISKTKEPKELIKYALLAMGAEVKNETEKSISAWIMNTKWTWENNKEPGDSTAFVIIKKFYDFGGNKLVKPSGVSAHWSFFIEGSKVTVKLAEVMAHYDHPITTTDMNAGYSLGNFERNVEGFIKDFIK